MANAKTILVVDDDPGFLYLLKETLEENQFRCITAESAGEALKKAENETPDLILLDLMLPVMSGHGLIRAFKSNPRFADIPVIVLSALTDGEIAVEMIEQGAVNYLSKACKADELLETVRQYAA